MSAKDQTCLMEGCSNGAARRGLCWTHYEHLTKFADIRVQRAVESHEREQLIASGSDLEWDYLTDEQYKAIERGVRDAYHEASGLNSYDLENLLQDMWIWCAGHRSEVEAVKSFKLLRQQARRWVIELHQTEWNANRRLDSYEALTEGREDI